MFTCQHSEMGAREAAGRGIGIAPWSRRELAPGVPVSKLQASLVSVTARYECSMVTIGIGQFLCRSERVDPGSRAGKTAG